MPDIIIKGMEMPRDCSRCSIKVDPETRQCCVDKHLFEETLSVLISRRDKDCPLAELPKHGDLIDAGSLYDDLVYDVELAERALDDTTLVGKERDYIQSEKDIKQNCAYYVSHAPVVIPAERSGDGG